MPVLPEEEIDEGDSTSHKIGHEEMHDSEPSAAMEIDVESCSNASHTSIYDTEINSFGVFCSYYRQCYGRWSLLQRPRPDEQSYGIDFHNGVSRYRR